MTRGLRKIEVEFGIKISDINPSELSGLLESLARLAAGPRVFLDEPTRALLVDSGHLPPPALSARRPWGISKAELEHALRDAGGSVPQAAKKLGCSVAHVYTLRKRYGLIPKEIG